MVTTGINEGHEKTATGATWQSDGLRDTDVLSSATLSNFVERAIYNGVVPVTLTDYSQDESGTDRNDPILGNCSVRKNTGGASNSIFVDTGIACLDGGYYSVGSAGAFNIDTASYYNTRFNPGGMILPAAVNEECWVLVIADPELSGTNNIGLVAGTVVDSSTGIYAQMPSSHLIKQSCVLGAARVTYGTPNLVVAAIEDKRVFIRGGPLPLTALFHSDGTASHPVNDYGTSPSLTPGSLPVTNMGTLYSRDPNEHMVLPDPTAVHGYGQTHLFYQADMAIGAGDGGAYQLTPVHRQVKEILSYTAPGGVGLQFTPLPCETDITKHIVTACWFSSSGNHAAPLKEGVHYTIAGKVLTFADLNTTMGPPLGPLGPGDVEVLYTHSGF